MLDLLAEPVVEEVEKPERGLKAATARSRMMRTRKDDPSCTQEIWSEDKTPRLRSGA